MNIAAKIARHFVRLPQDRPVVYFAGKIAPHDWRERFVGREVSLSTDEGTKLFDPLHTIERAQFIYGGPFYVACDHPDLYSRITSFHFFCDAEHSDVDVEQACK